MSEVQIGHCMVEAKLNNIDLDNLVVVGDEVGTVPSQASGSMNPRTMSLALARGLLRPFQKHPARECPAGLSFPRGLKMPHMVVEE